MPPKKYSQDATFLDCTPSFCEGDNPIQKLQGLCFSKFKIIIYTLLLNIFCPLLAYWFLYFRKALLFTTCPLSMATYFWIENKDGTQAITRKIQTKIKLSHNNSAFEATGFIHRRMLYYFDDSKNSFKVLELDIQIVFYDIQKQFGAGLTEELYQEYNKIYGPCQIEIRIPTIFRLFTQEILSPINFLQLLCLILWCLEDYYIYAIVVFVLSITSAVLNLIIIRLHYQNLNSMTNVEFDIEAVRVKNYQKERITIRSRELVPGDIIVLKNGMPMPCDCLLLNNQAVVNEVNLNGEPIPKIKSGIPYSEKIYSISDKTHTIFDGSTIAQVSSNTLALVIRTGFYTVKGELFRSIIYSTQTRLHFLVMQFFKYMVIMFFLALFGNIVGMVKVDDWSDPNTVYSFFDLFTVAIAPALPTCIFIGIFISIRLLKKKLISCYSPYRLLTAGSIDHLFLDKTGTLTEKDLYLKNVLLAYQKNFQENIETSQNRIQLHDFQKKRSDPIFMETLKEAINLASSCHNIVELRKKVGELEQRELTGDNIDLKIFEFSQGEIFFDSDLNAGVPIMQSVFKVNSQWKKIISLLNQDSSADSLLKPSEKNKVDDSELELFSIRPEFTHDSPIRQPEKNKDNESEQLSSLKIFEFSSEVQRMSVVVYSNPSKTMKCYTKGSPEAVKELCLQSSLPVNYNQRLLELTKQGFVVLSMAYKIIEFGEDFQLSVFERKKCESDLIFLGFFIFENCLKEDSIECFHILNKSGVLQKIVTGDSATTALVVAHKIGLIKDLSQTAIIDYQDSKIIVQKQIFTEMAVSQKQEFSTFLVNLKKESNINYERMFLMKAVSTESQNYLFLNSTQHNQPVQRKQLVSSSTPFLKDFFIYCKEILDYDIALSGKAFNYLFMKKADHFTLQESTLLQLILKSTKVFSRMLPMDKANLVRLHQKMGFMVGMIGDGLNDAAALKQADVGLSISDSNMNLSSSFSTKRTSLSSYIDLLKEGRKTVSNISHTFKYFALYSLIQFTNINALILMQAGLSNAQQLVEDLFLATTLVLASSLTAESQELSKERPVFDIFSVTNIFSLLGSGFIQLGGQIGVIFYIRSQDWYIPEINPSSDLYDYCAYCQSGNAIFMYSVILLINSILMTGNFQPDRQQFYKNWVFIILFLGLNIYSNIAFLYEPARLSSFDLVDGLIPEEALLIIWGLAWGTVVILCIWEHLVCRKIIRYFERKSSEISRENLEEEKSNDEENFNQRQLVFKKFIAKDNQAMGKTISSFKP